MTCTQAIDTPVTTGKVFKLFPIRLMNAFNIIKLSKKERFM